MNAISNILHSVNTVLFPKNAASSVRVIPHFSLPVSIILGLVVVVSLFWRFTLNFNSPYLDEADYIFVGRVLLNGEYWGTKNYVFSSDLPLLLIGFASQFHGIIGARALSLLLGLSSLAFAYWFYLALSKSRFQAFVATLFLALTANHIFVSKFATYDIICFFIFTVTVLLLFKVSDALTVKPLSRSTFCILIFLTIIAAGFMSLAVLSKYMVIAYLPLLAFVFFWRHKGLAVLFGFVSASIVGFYIFQNFENLKMLYIHQIAGSHAANATYLQLAWVTFQYISVFLILGIVGFFMRKRLFGQVKKWRIVALVLLAFPLVAYHFYAQDHIAFYKHMIYAQYFLAPVLALVFAAIYTRFSKTIGNTALCVCALLLIVISSVQVHLMERAYPNTNQVIQLIKQKIKPDSIIASEDPYLLRYALYPQTPMSQVFDYYYDNNLDGKFEAREIVDGLWDGKFDYVYMDARIDPWLTKEMREAVMHRQYKKILSIPYETNMVMSGINVGVIELYERKNDVGEAYRLNKQHILSLNKNQE